MLNQTDVNYYQNGAAPYIDMQGHKGHKRFSRIINTIEEQMLIRLVIDRWFFNRNFATSIAEQRVKMKQHNWQIKYL